jgi:hypothetical protein
MPYTTLKVSVAEFDGPYIPAPAKCAWTVYVPGPAGAGKGVLYPSVTAISPRFSNAVPVNVIVARKPGIPKPVQVSVNVPVKVTIYADGPLAGDRFNVKTVGCEAAVHGEGWTGTAPCEIVLEEEAVHESEIGEVPPAVLQSCISFVSVCMLMLLFSITLVMSW